jgi:hypothetical protein
VTNPRWRLAARSPGSWAVLAAAGLLAVGLFLRLQQLAAQWVTDDEWHAVHKIQGMTNGSGYLDILSSFGEADYSIPLTLIFRLLAATVGLDEVTLRLGPLAAGILLLILAWWLVRRRMGELAALLFLNYLALSAFHVYFSRNARPYSITLLFSVVAIVALTRWQARREWRWGVLYGLLTWTAAWMHLASAPFLLAPLLWVLLMDVKTSCSSDDWRQCRQTIALGLFLGAAIAAVVLPPLVLDAGALKGRIASDSIQLDTLVGAAHLWLGTASRIVVVAMTALAILGIRPVWQALRAELVLYLVGLGGIVVAVLVMRPAWIQNGVTLARYALPVLPLLLLLVAAGAVRLTAAIPAWPVRLPVVILLGLMPLYGSPHSELLASPNNFSLHSYHQFDYRLTGNKIREYMAAIPTSSFWERLARFPPGSLRVAVIGHGYISYFIGDVGWQPIHRQWLLNAQLSDYCSPRILGEGFADRGVTLRNAVVLADPGALRRQEIDLLVVKRPHEKTTPGYLQLEPCFARLSRDHGLPKYQDDFLIAYDLTGKLN